MLIATRRRIESAGMDALFDLRRHSGSVFAGNSQKQTRMPVPLESNTPATAGDFLAVAVKSRLLSEARAAEIKASLKRSATLDDVIARLQSNGELTPFQADKLRQGLWQGLVIGRFRIEEPIGRGGMGVVYRASDASAAGTPTVVALKILPPKKAFAEPRTKSRFLHEVKIGRTLPRDPHIARVYDTGVTDGIAYIAMEFVVGRTIRSVVAAHGPLTVPTAAKAFRDVALGLAALHAAGVIHRDVKPSNVMILPDGSAKLLDFGFALRPGEDFAADPSVMGGTGYTLGTFDFIPPEQVVNAAAVTPQSDQYSLGCSLYYTLTGQPPFPGGTAKDKLRKHKHEDAAPLSIVRPDLPVEFTAIVERLMAKQPQQRYSDCHAVAAALKRWLTVDAPAIDFTQESESEADDLADIAPHSLARVRLGRDRPTHLSPAIVGVFLIATAILIIILLIQLR
jgi:eukaryotic-like serine/threonine-protein kinase